MEMAFLIGLVSYLYLTSIYMTPAHSLSRSETLERGKKIPSPINPSELFQAYQETRTEYQSRAFGKNSKWKVLNEREGVQVSLLEAPGDPTCPYVRTKYRLRASVQESRNIMLNVMPKHDPFCEGTSILREYMYQDASMTLCRRHSKRIPPLFNRIDLALLRVVDDEPSADGMLVSGEVSVQTELLPRQQGYTRAFQSNIVFYEPLQGNTMTDLTVVCRIDMNDSGEGGTGGYFPMWLYVKTAARNAMQSALLMRKEMMVKS